MYALTTIIALLFLGWICLTEFTYVSQATHRQFYHWSARQYDRNKESVSYTCSPQQEMLFLGPIRDAVGQSASVRILDLACGTGRLAMLLVQAPWFLGRIEAFDQSATMLRCFENKLKHLPPEVSTRVTLHECDLRYCEEFELCHAEVVMLLEASELLPEFETVAKKAAQTLAPNGLFLLTKPPDWIAWLFPGRKQLTSSYCETLRRIGFRDISIKAWRWRYHVVYAWKR